MGSFNTTCAISHAPVSPRNKVRLFFLASTGSYREGMFNGCMCYPHDNFQIVGLPDKATYEDYNNYAIEDDETSKLTFNALVQHYEPNRVEEGKTLEDYNSFHDFMEIEKEELDWEKILDIMHSGRFFTKRFTAYEKIHITTMVVHESVYQAMIDNKMCDYDYEAKKHVSTTLDETITKWTKKFDSFRIEDDDDDPNFKEVAKNFRERIGKTEIRPEVGEWKGLSEEERTYTLTEEMVEKTLKSVRRSFRRSRIREITRDYPMCYMVDLANWAENYSNDIVPAFSELLHFHGAMMSYNFMYQPLMTCGQVYTVSPQINFLRKITSALEEVDKNDDDALTVTKKVETYYSIKLSYLKEQWKDWFSKKVYDGMVKEITNAAAGEAVFPIDMTTWEEDDTEYFGAIYDNIPASMQEQTIHIMMEE